jgi:hypothetical protein
MATTLINGFEIDCTVHETYSRRSDITEYPVEAGAAVVDHIRPLPDVITLEGIVSDTPFGDLAARRGMDPDLLNPRGLPSEQALAVLRDIHNAREPVTIETARGVFENMAMESFDDEPRNADALFFVAVFKQVKIVRNERTTVRVATPRASRRIDRGNQQPDPVTTVPAPTSDRAKRALGRFNGPFSPPTGAP